MVLAVLCCTTGAYTRTSNRLDGIGCACATNLVSLGRSLQTSAFFTVTLLRFAPDGKMSRNKYDILIPINHQFCFLKWHESARRVCCAADGDDNDTWLARAKDKHSEHHTDHKKEQHLHGQMSVSIPHSNLCLPMTLLLGTILGSTHLKT